MIGRVLNKFFKRQSLYRLAFPPGHYASPIPNVEEALRTVRNEFNEEILDIDLNRENQLKLFKSLIPFIREIPFTNHQNNKSRYYFSNPMFQHMDGAILYGLAKYFNPRKYIEVGSGFSSALMLDLNEETGTSIKLTFIEPYPQRLNTLLTEKDRKHAEIVESKIQNTDLSIFDTLQKNDILFLDTSHIVKTGSDVNYWLFHILPRLNSGVIIHIHDIFWPFEYSEEWIRQQKCYNEIYLIRAFLMNNKDYEILHFNSYIFSEYGSLINDELPNLDIQHGGGSLWLVKK